MKGEINSKISEHVNAAKCLHHFGQKTSKEQTIWKTKLRWDDDITMYLW
jgi:hypothetical protein